MQADLNLCWVHKSKGMFSEGVAQNTKDKTTSTAAYLFFFNYKVLKFLFHHDNLCCFVCVEVIWRSQPNGVMLSVVSLPNHFYWAGLFL